MDERAKSDAAFILSVIKYALLILLVICFLYIGLKALVILSPILIALFLSQVSVTVSQYIMKKFKIQDSRNPSIHDVNRVRNRIAVFIYIILLLLILALLSGIFYSLIAIIRYISLQFPKFVRESDIINQISNFFRNVSGPFGLELNPAITLQIEESTISLVHNVIDALPSILGSILSSLSKWFSGMPRAILVLIITVMTGYYFITQSSKLYRFLLRFIPRKDFIRKIFTATSQLTVTLFRIIGGYVVLMFVTLAEAFVGFLVVGLPNPFLWSIVAAVVDLLPILGITTTLIPISVYFFIQSSPLQGVGILIMMVVIIIIRRLIEPIILGSAMRLHPIVTILSMIIGIMIYGISGILLGPLAFVILRELFITFEAETKIRNYFKVASGSKHNAGKADKV